MTQRERDLKATVDCALGLLEGTPRRTIAKKMGKCLSTVDRLIRGEYSPAVQYDTVMALCHAAGLVLSWNRNGRAMLKLSA